MNVINIKLKKETDNECLKLTRDGDACFDIRANHSTQIRPNCRELVRTGMFLELPYGVEMQVRPRSGLAIKNGITVLNTPGTIDSNYRGEVGIVLYNTSNEAFEVEEGDRIAQGCFKRVEEFLVIETDELSSTNRGNGGFGSSGVK